MLCSVTSYMSANDVTSMMALHYLPKLKPEELELRNCKFQQILTMLLPFVPYDPTKKISTHFVILSTYKNTFGVWKSEVGSGKSTKKAEDIQLFFYIFIWEIQLFIF